MKVGIHSKEERLIFVGNDDNRRIMALDLPDSKAVISLVKKTVAKIGIEFHHGDEYYDLTLLKYNPRTIEKAGTEISTSKLFDLSNKDLFKKEALVQLLIITRSNLTAWMLEKHLNIQSAKIYSQCVEAFTCVYKRFYLHTVKTRIWLLISTRDWVKGSVPVSQS